MRTRLISPILCSVFIAASAAWAEDLYLQVRASKLREQPKIWSRSVGDLNYGDRLSVLSRTAGWVQVQTSKAQKGFVAESAVSGKKVVFSGRTTIGDASADEIVLAGKGFNREVEQSMKAADAMLNYRAVDEMETLRVSPEELRTFITSGKLSD